MSENQENEVVIYGLEVCPQCKVVKMMCDQKGLKTKYLKMDVGKGGDYTKKDLLKAMGIKIPKGKTEDDYRLSAPQIFVNEKLIGGMSQFQDWLRNNAA